MTNAAIENKRRCADFLDAIATECALHFGEVLPCEDRPGCNELWRRAVHARGAEIMHVLSQAVMDEVMRK